MFFCWSSFCRFQWNDTLRLWILRFFFHSLSDLKSFSYAIFTIYRRLSSTLCFCCCRCFCWIRHLSNQFTVCEVDSWRIIEEYLLVCCSPLCRSIFLLKRNMFLKQTPHKHTHREMENDKNWVSLYFDHLVSLRIYLEFVHTHHIITLQFTSPVYPKTIRNYFRYSYSRSYTLSLSPLFFSISIAEALKREECVHSSENDYINFGCLLFCVLFSRSCLSVSVVEGLFFYISSFFVFSFYLPRFSIVTMWINGSRMTKWFLFVLFFPSLLCVIGWKKTHLSNIKDMFLCMYVCMLAVSLNSRSKSH